MFLQGIFKDFVTIALCIAGVLQCDEPPFFHAGKRLVQTITVSHVGPVFLFRAVCSQPLINGSRDLVCVQAVMVVDFFADDSHQVGLVIKAGADQPVDICQYIRIQSHLRNLVFENRVFQHTFFLLRGCDDRLILSPVTTRLKQTDDQTQTE